MIFPLGTLSNLDTPHACRSPRYKIAARNLPDTNAVGTMSKFVAVPGNAVATVRSLQHTTPGNAVAKAVAKAVVKVVCNTSI